MRILFICHEFPIPSYAGTLRVLHSLEPLSRKFKHEITLVACKIRGKDYPDLSRYCRVETVETAIQPGLRSPRAFFSGLKNLVQLPFSLLNFTRSPAMSRKIRELLDNNKYDVIVIDHPSMLLYISNIKVPLVLLEAFELAEIALMEYKNEKNRLIKIIRLLYYLYMRGYAKRYRAASAIIAVSNQQRDIVLSHCADLDITVIPIGIDSDYFKPVEPETPFPSIIITGSMHNPANAKMVLSFYNEIYPHIKEMVPRTQLYIVGSNPGREILELAADGSTVVTGYVADLSPYLSHAWVVVAPLQEGFGMKVRVQQAMTAGKPVVGTSMVLNGIDVSPGENIIIADEAREFADKVVELLNNREMRARVGAAARQLMITRYSWGDMADRINTVLERVAGKQPPA